jgi:hypothetical protein
VSNPVRQSDLCEKRIDYIWGGGGREERKHTRVIFYGHLIQNLVHYFARLQKLYIQRESRVSLVYSPVISEIIEEFFIIDTGFPHKKLQ